MAVDKNKLIAEATRLVQKGQWDKAIKSYERIVAEDPKDVRVLLKIGELQQKKNDLGAAATTMHAVAEAYTEQGFFLKAVAVYKQIVRLAPDDTRVNERLAALYQQLGIMSDAMAQLQLVAAAAERTGDEAKLAEVLRRMTELDPENPAPTARLGEILARQGDTRGALDLLRRSADALKKANRMDEYFRVAERVVALEPGNAALGRELAQLYLGRGDTRRALAKLQLCFKADPDDITTLNLLAQAFRELGQVSKTVSVYKELARIHSQHGRAEESRKAWQRVLDLAPDDPDALEAITGPEHVPGVDFPAPPQRPPERTSPLDAAEAPADAAVAPPAAPAPAAESAPPPPVGPEAIPKLLSETDVYLKYGLNAKAAEHLGRVFAIDRENLGALERMRDLRATLGDLDGAVDHGLRAARAAEAAGDGSRARLALERLQAIAPGHPALADLPSTTVDAAPVAPAPDPEHEHEHAEIVVEVDADHEGGTEDLLAPAAAADGDSGIALTGTAQPDLADELAEIDFYVDQGLLDEAREALSSLRALYPADAGLAARLERLQKAEIEAALATGDTLAPGAAEEDAALSGLQYSVDDALDQFRKGIEQQVRPEDADTHFDLGIAYREMGLLDEALRELGVALAARPGRKELDCLTMIGLVRLEQGDASGAISAYRAALASPHADREATRALHYELAMAYRAAGDLDAARWFLEKVLREDPAFRDARGQVTALGEGEARPPPDEPEISGAPGVAATS